MLFRSVVDAGIDHGELEAVRLRQRVDRGQAQQQLKHVFGGHGLLQVRHAFVRNAMVGSEHHQLGGFEGQQVELERAVALDAGELLHQDFHAAQRVFGRTGRCQALLDGVLQQRVGGGLDRWQLQAGGQFGRAPRDGCEDRIQGHGGWVRLSF